MTTNSRQVTFIPSLTFTDYEWFPWSICNGCDMPAGNTFPSGHLVPSSIVGLVCAPVVETRFIELAMPLLDLSPRIPLGIFSSLLPFKFYYDFSLSGAKRQLLSCFAFLYFSFATTYPAMYLVMFHEFKGRTELVTPIGNLITSTKEVEKVDLVKSLVDSIDMLYYCMQMLNSTSVEENVLKLILMAKLACHCFPPTSLLSSGCWVEWGEVIVLRRISD